MRNYFPFIGSIDLMNLSIYVFPKRMGTNGLLKNPELTLVCELPIRMWIFIVGYPSSCVGGYFPANFAPKSVSNEIRSLSMVNYIYDRAHWRRI